MIDYRDGVVVLSLVGEHDLATAPALEQQLTAHIGGDVGIVLSLVDATFLDSSVLHLLCRADKSLMSRGRRVVLHTGGTADRILDLSGLRQAFLCCESVDEAVAFARQDSQTVRT